MTDAPQAAPGATFITDVELGRPLVALETLDPYAAVRAVVRMRGVPVAQVRVPVRDGRVSPQTMIDAVVADRAAEVTRQLLRRWLARPDDANAPTWAALESEREVAALAEFPEPAEPALPTITVAVCTRDRPDDLARCLTALAALDYPTFDVLVVDNAPRTEATATLVRERFGAFGYVREPRPGLDWARSRAIVEARGEVLAYTDDDVVPDVGWLRALGRVFGASPGVMAVSGMIEPAELETQAQLDFETYCGFGHGWARRWLYRPRRAGRPDFWHHGAGWLGTGANMAFRRTLFDSLGGFDPALDVGTVTQGGGDLDIFFRVVQEGHLLVYAPEALVRHRHRRGDDELRRQLTTWGSGYHAFLRRSRRAYPEERRAFDRLARWWWAEYVAKGIARGRFGRSGPTGTLVGELRPYEVRGTLRGLRSYDRASRIAAELLARHPNEPTLLPRPSAPREPKAVAGDAGSPRTVHLDAPVVAGFENVGPDDSVRVIAMAGGELIAAVDVVPERGAVSALQLRDALATALTNRLLARDQSTGEPRVQRSLDEWLTNAM